MNLEGLPKEIMLYHQAKCHSKYQGYLVFKEGSSQHYFLSMKSPSQDISIEDKNILAKYDGQYMKLCQEQAEEYVWKYLKPEIKNVNDCYDVCLLKHPKTSIFNLPSRSRCNRKCQDQLNVQTKQKINSGEMVGVREIVS